MVNFLQKSTWLILLILCVPLSLTIATEETQMEETTTLNITEPKTNSTKDLEASETADPKKVDIVKQIRRLNEDGSYTVGYEAGDGTFKIESRDVQGNIKGTFGYVDNDGEIKRVSYSTSNGTHSPLLIPIAPTFNPRFNRTASSTTRRPQPSIVYSKSSSSGSPTKPTVIQAIPRRRPTTSTIPTPTVTTTESYRVVTANQLPLNNTNPAVDQKILKQFPIFTQRTETVKPVFLPVTESAEPKVYHQNGQQRMPVELNDTVSTTVPNIVRSSLVYEKTSERPKESPKTLRANTYRRQLNPISYDNEQMYVLQQSAGDDTTDVYGGSIAVGTSRPLFTTTTGRPRTIPLHTILASRQKLHEKLVTVSPQVHEDQQETALEATTNKIGEDSYVTSNPVPVIQIPINENIGHQGFIKAPIHFRTREYLRDNPGAPVPIGNQRALFRYNPPVNVNGQYIRQLPRNVAPIPIPNPHIVNNIQSENPSPEVETEKPNVIPIPIQQRYPTYNQYVQQQERIENIPPRVPVAAPVPVPNEIPQISTPVSTKDLKRLLQQLLIRQNRLQTLMDIRDDYTPQYNNPYVPQPIYEDQYRQKYRPFPPPFQNARPYNGFIRQAPYDPNYPYQPIYTNQYPNRNDFRPQDDGYRNDIMNYDPAMPYESQRYVPRRRFLRPRVVYDPRYEEPNSNAVTEPNEEQPEYLPPDVREALLLKMLMLAIHPDFQVAPEPQTAVATTPPPIEYRKKVRNVQILGEEPETKEVVNEQKKRIDRTTPVQN